MTYLKDSLLCRTMALPGDQEKIEQVFFSVPLCHRQKYAETHKLLFRAVSKRGRDQRYIENAKARKEAVKNDDRLIDQSQQES
jgi:hypothetical protein